MTNVIQEFRALIISNLAAQPMTATEIGNAIGDICPRRVAATCAAMERDGLVSRSGLARAGNNCHVPLWCLPGQERRGEARLVAPRRGPARAPSYEPVSVTALICGDPLPGRSALAMREAQR